LHGNCGGISFFVIVNWEALQFEFQRGQTLTRPSGSAERISSANLLSLKSGQTMQAPQAQTTVARQRASGNFHTVHLIGKLMQLPGRNPKLFVVVLRLDMKK
jgi:hypothetical protein